MVCIEDFVLLSDDLVVQICRIREFLVKHNCEPSVPAEYPANAL